MNKMKSFVKQFIAIVNGDDAEALGQKTLRQADSAFNSHIPSLEGDKIDLETEVEKAKEKLDLARVNNGKAISDRRLYISNLIEAQNGVVAAQEALEAHTAKIEFLKAQQALLD